MQASTRWSVCSSNHRKEQGVDTEGQSPPTTYASLTDEAISEPGVLGCLLLCLLVCLML